MGIYKKPSLNTTLGAWTGPFDPALPAAMLRQRVAKLVKLSTIGLRETYSLTAPEARRTRIIVERAQLGCAGTRQRRGRAIDGAWRECEALYADVVRRLEGLAQHPNMRRPLMDWRVPAENILPGVTRLSVSEVAAMPFKLLKTKRGFSVRKMRILVELLSRVADSRENTGFKPFVLGARPTAAGRRDPWPACQKRFEELSRVLASCESAAVRATPLWAWRRSAVDRNMSHQLSRRTIDEFSRVSFDELAELPSVGLKKLQKLCVLLSRAAKDIAAGLDAPPSTSPAPTPPVAPARVPPEVEAWFDRALKNEPPPSVAQITQGLLRPLLRVVEETNGKRAALFAASRLGLDRPPLSLAAVGKRAGVSYERVRQVLAKVTERMKETWPAGLDRIAALYEKTWSPTDETAQVGLLARSMRLFCGCKPDELSFRPTSEILRRRVIEWWQRQVRRRRTPFTGTELRAALSAAFPAAESSQIEQWLADETLTRIRRGGETWYFGRGQLDPLLLELCRARKPLPLAKAASLVGTNTRWLGIRIDRDLRFMLNSDRHVTASVPSLLVRREREWRLELVPDKAHRRRPRITEVPAHALVQMVVDGLSARGVGDATTRGVRRYVDETLRREQGAGLAAVMTPMQLGRVLVEESAGRVRHERRQRLVWGPATGDARHRGKRGWISHIVRHAAGPMTLPEMWHGMNRYYQDYDFRGFEVWLTRKSVAGIELADGPKGSRLPSIVWPTGWRFDGRVENLSEGVRDLIESIANALAKGRARWIVAGERGFNKAPWLIELADAHAARNAPGKQRKRHDTRYANSSRGRE